MRLEEAYTHFIGHDYNEKGFRNVSEHKSMTLFQTSLCVWEKLVNLRYFGAFHVSDAASLVWKLTLMHTICNDRVLK